MWRCERWGREEGDRRDERRERSSSREREHRYRHTERYPPPFRNGNLGQDRTRCSAERGADDRRAAALDSRALTREVGSARSLLELLSLEERYGDRFNHFHLGAFWSKFKKLPRGELSGLRDRLAPVC